ncbi:hypothetical protein PMG11_02204 [Penicillium brasilianum]|uniref:Uncharacterized protein n=1 Tax=Penicillium brasilianum TaxID=104259 RepID=A0A0F7TJA7_PENBI|nr:hypothetical protein PMG11_02204 [Penicillium brasilianum]
MREGTKLHSSSNFSTIVRLRQRRSGSWTRIVGSRITLLSVSGILALKRDLNGLSKLDSSAKIIRNDGSARLVESTRSSSPLREDDRVLTRADTRDYGVKSNEVVAIPTEENIIRLWGFNQEKPFFTKGHVFHTNTGLRAKNHAATRRENRWLVVGKLCAVHTLYFTDDGHKYQRITIESWKHKDVECKYIWGLHLREGLRSYI